MAFFVFGRILILRGSCRVGQAFDMIHFGDEHITPLLHVTTLEGIF
jgi:hypothetical protein